jgi:hypothetical protein
MPLPNTCGRVGVGLPGKSSAAASAAEGPVRGEKFVLDLGEGANDLDWLLAGAEDRPRREAHGRILEAVTGLREELRLLETIDQAADIRPIELERPGAHGTGLAGRDQCAGPQ